MQENTSIKSFKYLLIRGILFIAIPMTLVNNLIFNMKESPLSDLLIFNTISFTHFSILACIIALFKYKYQKSSY
jgi:hypothetical protein